LFYDLGFNDGNTSSTYTPSLGYRLQVGVEKAEIEGIRIPFRFSFAYDNYAGNINIRRGGLGGSARMNMDLRKSIIGIGIYPFNPRVRDHIALSFGLEGAMLVNEIYEGTLRSSTLNGSSTRVNLSNKYQEVSPEFQLGFRAKCTYEIKLENGLIFSPQYSLYLGLSREIMVFSDKPRSMRHFFGIGLKKYIPYEER
ncbi:MAG: hypothetical protein AAF927_26865, partial [Bacteroidota bacterium]